MPHRPITLLILDGWGYREEKEANAILSANTPTFDQLWKTHPHTCLQASGGEVGLPNNQMGNSEVGHLNLGAGRVVFQSLSRITNAIEDHSFFQNRVFLDVTKQAKQQDKAIHIFGLLSPGGIHSHEEHLFALIRLCAEQGIKKIYVHAFLDGRDTPPKSAEASLIKLDNLFQTLGAGKLISLVGRFYVMDRDKRWDRVEKAYNLLTLGVADHQAETAIKGLHNAYENNETDEFVKPTTIHAANEKPITINDGDNIIFMNFRADRAREITRAFIEPNFNEFNRKKIVSLNAFVSLTQHDATFNTTVAFPPKKLTNTLGEYLAQHNKKQLRIAETEKYAHVTFFFNGGIEVAFPGEDRQLIASPKVDTYDLQPEMSALELTDKLIQAIENQTYDVIICNFANPDMVGHTGNFDATVKAVECIDSCLKKIITTLEKVGGEAIITADHGNAEFMYNPKTEQAHTAHTCSPVPFIYIGRPATITEDSYALCDIAPTLLYLLGLNIPKEMTGKPIIKVQE